MKLTDIKKGQRVLVTFGRMRIALEVTDIVIGAPVFRGRNLITGAESVFSPSDAEPFSKPVITITGIKHAKHLLNRAAKALDEVSIPGGDVLRSASADSIGAAPTVVWR